ncbi:thermosome subunit beta [Candidatus Methanodesulfokora washburnensis]|uniref:Thermosome subunit n=1 Tax=Candidatus Methanodesulfokora washburnensis TaxID=2478471 RepID=A0A3R9X647_9CREN|nr:thermosome subunit beta [Candidatus Methanodesulfokores washburnensis]RSN76301.1 thermosome subunit [Candidatus Methanodesulfokores washburnensis]
MANIGGRPVLILKEGTTRTKGEEARRINMEAAKAIADIIKTSLGPKGMDKMIVDSLGDITVSNDGATILQEMEVAHPAAKLMVNLAKAQDKEAGDGTTTAVVLAGELIEKAEDLLNKDIHPTIIIDGFEKALKYAQEELDNLATKVNPDDKEWLIKVATTAMASKMIRGEKEFLARIAVESVLSVAEEHNGKKVVDIDNVKIMKKKGKSLSETEYVKGIVLDKEVVHRNMPRRVENAKIALLNVSLEVKKPEIDVEVQVSSPQELRGFIEQETKMLQEKVEKIAASGANVVFCQKGIDEVAQHFLAKRGILAARRISEKDMTRLEKATGGRIISNLDDLTPESLGYAGLVEERKVGDDRMIFVENCKNPKAVTILLRAGADTILDEAERGLKDALYVTRNVVEDGKVLWGGGAVQQALAIRLRRYAEKVGGKDQLAIEAFADALESIPRILAENAGMDSVDAIVRLRKEHSEGRISYGIDPIAGDIADMAKLNVVDTYRAVRNALAAATETATLIIKTDDIISAKPYEKEEKKEKGEKEKEEEKGFGKESEF